MRQSQPNRRAIKLVCGTESTDTWNKFWRDFGIHFSCHGHRTGTYHCVWQSKGLLKSMPDSGIDFSSPLSPSGFLSSNLPHSSQRRSHHRAKDLIQKQVNYGMGCFGNKYMVHYSKYFSKMMAISYCTVYQNYLISVLTPWWWQQYCSNFCFLYSSGLVNRTDLCTIWHILNMHVFWLLNHVLDAMILLFTVSVSP